MGDKLQSAIAAHQAGRIDEAIALYKTVIAENPAKAQAHYLLGCLKMEASKFEEARVYLLEAIRLSDTNSSYYSAIGTLCRRSGDNEAAIGYLRTAIALPKPKDESFRNLGYLLIETFKAPEAVQVFRKAIKKFGESIPMARGLLESSSAANNADGLREATAILRKLGVMKPETLKQIEYKIATLEVDKDKALEIALKWLASTPDSATALLACADAMKGVENFPEALRYGLLALEKEPEKVETLILISNILIKLDRFSDAVRYFKLAHKAAPDNKFIFGGLSYALFKTASTRETSDNIEEAYYYGCKTLDCTPEDVRALSGMSSILMNMLRVREGLDYYKRYVFKDDKAVYNDSSRMFHDNYAWYLSRDEVFARHLNWAKLAREKAGPALTHFDNNPDPDRPLRIGFSSGDLFYHPVSYFFMSVFQELRKHFEVYLYSQKKEADEDDMTKRYREDATAFRVVESLSDEELQKLTIEDKIDVMIDLAGHTSNNRLVALAKRLAPVQAEWLGYPNTTGLDTMDYRISDAITEPEGDADRYSTERIIRLPGGFHLYRPTYRVPEEVVPLPALTEGVITFGCFNNLKKASPNSFRAWARLMREVPNSRLALKDRNVEPRYVKDRLLAIMASYGIASSRITIKGLQKNNFDHMMAYSRIDIALDTFPYNGTTTTCEATVMGCPVVTIIGDTHVSRVSSSILTHVGHPEWIARDEDEFVEIGRKLASDVTKLSEIRSNLRQQMYASPLCDADRMCKELSDAIRMMWRDWCSRAKIT